MFSQNINADFGKAYKYCHLKILEKWKKNVGKGNIFGALLTDLSKVFDCLDLKLLTSKLNAYSCNICIPALRLVHDYLSNEK